VWVTRLKFVPPPVAVHPEASYYFEPSTRGFWDNLRGEDPRSIIITIIIVITWNNRDDEKGRFGLNRELTAWNVGRPHTSAISMEGVRLLYPNLRQRERAWDPEIWD